MTASERLELWESHRGLATSLARRRLASLPGVRDQHALDDLRQAADVALWEATAMWCDGLGLSFVSYAYRHIRGQVLRASWQLLFWGFNGNRASYLKGMRLLSRRTRLWTGQEEGGRLSDGSPDGHPMYLPSDASAARDVALSLLRQINSDTERECVRMTYLEGLSTRDIATKLNLSVDRVEQARPAGIRRMRIIAARMGLFDE